MQILKLTTDVVFKIFFSNQEDTTDLSNFLLAALDLPQDEITDITIQNPMLEAFDVLEKDAIVDLKVKTKHGKIIHIEMQVENHDAFQERIVYYNARALSSQLKKGWDYSQLKKVISIVIADFEMFEDEKDYHNVFQMINKKGTVVFSDISEIHTLELPKATKKNNNELELWLSLFKAKTEEECNMLASQSQTISKAVVKLKSLSEDEKTRMLAEDREQAIAIRKAQRGLALKEGKQEGFKEGKQEGFKEGETQKAFEIAKNLLNLGLQIEQISISTNLTYHEIENLQKEMIK